MMAELPKMMGKMFKRINRKGGFVCLIFGFSILCTVSAAVFAADSRDEIIGSIGLNARGVALGGSFGAITSDIDGIFLNPAGISRFDTQQVVVGHNVWQNGISYEYLGYVDPMDSFTLGVSAIYSNPLGSSVNLDNFSRRNLGLTLTVGRRFEDNLMVGVNVKGVEEEVDTGKTTSLVMDLAGLYRLGLGGITMGFGIQNIG